MSVTAEQDPIEQVLSILQATSDPDWTNATGKPAHIERMEATAPQQKETRSNDAIYVRPAGEGTVDSLGAGYDGVLDDQSVIAEAWTKTSAAEASNLRLDIRSIINDTYWNDNRSTTAWRAVRAVGEEGLQAEKLPRKADHFRVQQRIELDALR